MKTRVKRAASSAAVRFVAAIALILWPFFFVVLLAAFWPPKMTIWQEFKDGGIYLLKRIRLGGL